MIYLDHNAITPMRPEALAAVEASLSAFGNPSSVHAAGREARGLIEEARAQTARALSVDGRDLVFTSGATEAASLAIRGMLESAPEERHGLVVTAVEHPCVLDLASELARRGTPVQVVPVDGDGVVDMEVLANAVSPETAVVACMLANNETGVIQPVAEAAAAAHRAGALLFCDAVQAVGKIPFDIHALGADAAALTAQKFGGARGAGALWLAPGVQITPQFGGHQERGRRAGTENLAGICALGAAIAVAALEVCAEGERVRALRDRLEQGLLASVPGTRVNGARARRLPGTSSVTFSDVDGEALLMAMDLEGVCASAGAACTSGSTKPSHVLKAMGLSTVQARGTLRLSLGWSSSEEDVEGALRIIPPLIARVRDAIRIA